MKMCETKWRLMQNSVNEGIMRMDSEPKICKYLHIGKMLHRLEDIQHSFEKYYKDCNRPGVGL